MAGDKMREDQLQAVWFAAGTAALIACIERAVVVSLFAHWRVWAFLALNLLLLAILFTSKSQIQSQEIGDQNNDYLELNMKQRKQEQVGPVVSGSGEGGESVKLPPESRGAAECETKIVKEEETEQISKEELNQRAEAFIAMFRQHLVSDAKSFRPRSGQLYSRNKHRYISVRET